MYGKKIKQWAGIWPEWYLLQGGQGSCQQHPVGIETIESEGASCVGIVGENIPNKREETWKDRGVSDTSVECHGCRGEHGAMSMLGMAHEGFEPLEGLSLSSEWDGKPLVVLSREETRTSYTSEALLWIILRADCRGKSRAWRLVRNLVNISSDRW